MTSEAEGGASVWVLLSILRRYARYAVLVGLAVGLLVHLGLGLYAARTQTTYVSTFEIRYRSGTAVLAGISKLVGRDLPSLRLRSTIETQMEILQSEKLRKATMRRLGREDEFEEGQEPYQLKLRHKENTDIIVVEVRGKDKEGVKEYAKALLLEYRLQDVRAKRAKDTELQEYVKEQIAAQERKLEALNDIVAKHRKVAPKERERERSLKRVEEATTTIKVERRKRQNKHDALLEKYTADHPTVRDAAGGVEAIEGIADAESSKDLKPYMGGVEAQWAALRAEIFQEQDNAKKLAAEIKSIRDEIGARPEVKKLLRTGDDPEQVQREQRLAQETYEGLRRRLNQIELSIQDSSSDVDTLSEPDVQSELVVKNKWQWVLGVALLCAIATPFVLESLVVTSHTVADLERVSGLPTLAAIPRMNDAVTNGTALMVAGSAASDEIRLLRTNIESSLDYPPRRLILVAGAEPGEGKSMIAVNLAATYAEMGVPTLLVDLDLRRPVVHQHLKVRRSPGVTEVVGEDLNWKRAIQIPEVDNLHVLPAGMQVEDSGGTLATVRLAEVLSEMREVFSVVICDSPALTAVADASLVARRADAVVLVYALSTTPHRSLQRTLSMLNTAKAKVLGVVANDKSGLAAKRSYRYGAYYYQSRSR